MIRLKCLSFEETLARALGVQKRTFCVTGAVGVLQGAVVRRLISG